MSAAPAPSQTAMKRLAVALSFVCLGLFLLAIEQKHAVAAWERVRDGAGPAVRRAADGAGRLPSAAAAGFRSVRSAVAGGVRDLAAAPVSRALATGGRIRPAWAPLENAGSLSLVGAELRFDTGETLRTRPLRIAIGSDHFAPGQSFADRLHAPPDAQIELREVTAQAADGTAAPLSLCGGEPAGVAALLYRGDQIDLMLFRAGVTVGATTPPSALCGAWSFTVR